MTTDSDSPSVKRRQRQKPKLPNADQNGSLTPEKGLLVPLRNMDEGPTILVKVAWCLLCVLRKCYQLLLR